MTIIDKVVHIDFKGGEYLQDAIRDAVQWSCANRVAVAFNFNGIPMRIKSTRTSTELKDVRVLKREVEQHIAEYDAAWDNLLNPTRKHRKRHGKR